MNIAQRLRWPMLQKSILPLTFCGKYNVTEITNEISFTPKFH